MLQRIFKVRQGTVWFKSGHIYKMTYSNFQNDPEPTIIVLCAIKGTHPTSGNRHNYLQAINLTYIPRAVRKQFTNIWTVLLKRTNGNVTLTWEMVTRQYPYLKLAVRRYYLDRHFIAGQKEIPLEQIDQVVIGSWAKDYSKQAFIRMVSAHKKAAKALNVNKLKEIFGGRI